MSPIAKLAVGLFYFLNFVIPPNLTFYAIVK